MDTKKMGNVIAVPLERLRRARGEQTRPTPAEAPSDVPPDYDWLAPNLRRMYDEVLNEPIPDSFVELLMQLHEREKRR